MDQTTETVLLTRWLKQEGEAVHKGEAICEIETDKATVEIESNADGLLRKMLIKPGTRIPPRTVVGLVGLDSDTLPDIDPYYQTPEARPSSAPASSPTGRGSNTPAPAPSPTGGGSNAPSTSREVKVSPRARRLAEEHQIDLATMTGSGPEGRILEEDVKVVIEGKLQVATTTSPTTSATRVTRAKAERVSLSWRTIPHFHMAVTVDMSQIERRKSSAGKQITYTDLIALALSQTLPQHPMLNGHWQNDMLTMIPQVRLGLVVQTERGLVIPAMQDLRGRSLEDIATEREQLVQQAHAGALAASAIQEPTFTLSNVGPGHIDAFNAIISPPQVAILSVGSIQQRPHVVDSQLVIRPTATLTLGVDHRAIDGRQAAAFLEQLKATLES
jgi:pyruvate dehydrogenase E2 component (dihydrolipoamide acetyltransferase)